MYIFVDPPQGAGREAHALHLPVLLLIITQSGLHRPVSCAVHTKSSTFNNAVAVALSVYHLTEVCTL